MIIVKKKKDKQENRNTRKR